MQAVAFKPTRLAIARPRVTRSSMRANRLQVNAGKFAVTLILEGGKSETFEVGADEVILDIAEEKGLDLPSSCRSGACSSCTGKLVKGAAPDQADQNHLTDEQLAKGYILTCVAYPTGDCTIETHKEDDLY